MLLSCATRFLVSGQVLPLNVHDFTTQHDRLRNGPGRTAFEYAHLFTYQELLLDDENLFHDGDDEHVGFFPHRRHMVDVVDDPIDRDVLDDHLLDDNRRLDYLFAGLDALLNAHPRARNLVFLDGQLFGDNGDGDLCRFRILKVGTRADTIAAIALPNHRLSRHHESGPVGELHEKLSGSLLSDDLAARAIVTNHRCSLHMSPRLWRMTRQHRSSVGRAAVPGLPGCDRASARHTIGAR